MAHGWISGLLKLFFLVCTNFSPEEQGSGREGWKAAQTPIQHCLEQEKPPKVATLSPYHTTKPRKLLANNGNSSRSWLAQLVPSIGAILVTMTLQGQQNAFQKTRPLSPSHWTCSGDTVHR